MNAEEMPCQELVELISDYLEDRLSARDRSRFEQHLEECPYCVEYLEQMRLTVGAVGRLAEEEVTPDARRDLVRLFRDWRAERNGSPG